jgi:hypothetical protein
MHAQYRASAPISASDGSVVLSAMRYNVDQSIMGRSIRCAVFTNVSHMVYRLQTTLGSAQERIVGSCAKLPLLLEQLSESAQGFQSYEPGYVRMCVRYFSCICHHPE